jgi:hypothetical protein
MSCHDQVHVISHDRQRRHPPVPPGGSRPDQLPTPAHDPAAKYRPPGHGAPPHAIPQAADDTCGNLHLPGHASDDTHSLCQTTRFLRRLKAAVPSRGA